MQCVVNLKNSPTVPEDSGHVAIEHVLWCKDGRAPPGQAMAAALFPLQAPDARRAVV